MSGMLGTAVSQVLSGHLPFLYEREIKGGNSDIYNMVYVVGEYNMSIYIYIYIATGGPWMSKPILGTKCKDD